MTSPSRILRPKFKDKEATKIINAYAIGSLGTMVAIPVPGVDMAATYALWGKMIYELAKVYGHEVSFQDARALAVDLIKGVVGSAAAWYGSAKMASTVLKFVPVAGTVTAYLIDAIIAGFGASKVTSALGFAAAAYYKSDKQYEPSDFMEEVSKILKDPKLVSHLLEDVKPGRKKRKRST